ncbi:hypothetical protein GQ43DRAFT_374462 [Delitschia confertaspora ATCC 74209]|uniref:Uncharacterized protein n=1 Tax=Delitschia confertaspora ATCC 74209 TaxID=1513339 RepID=A0A9P4MRQ3_9PLEO|nr:hypothetical protein GQ43DRAFT_374462 [Delitschia confertaspora ATCC 74209]
MPLAPHPTSASSSGTRTNPQGYGYGYEDGSQFVASAIPPTAGVATGVGYAAGYTPDQHRASQYQQYGQMYNVPSQPTQPPQSPYDPVQQAYPQRQNTAIEVLSNQFGVAQPYYVQGEGGPAGASTPAPLATQNMPSQYSSIGYTTQQSPVGRETLASTYTAAGMNEPQQPTSSGAQAPYDAQTGSVPSLDDSYQQYQMELKRAFECIRDGRLRDAGNTIHHISDFLLNSIDAFGLARDEAEMYHERLKLWEDFNYCWLAALQKEKEMLQQMIEVGQRPQQPQSLIEYDYLQYLGDTLVKACDQMEKHGLVDYQMGVWEEDIIAMITQCMDLWEEAGVGSSTQRVPLVPTSRRR